MNKRNNPIYQIPKSFILLCFKILLANNMRLLRKIKYIIAAGAAGGVLASYLAVSAAEANLEEKHREDPGLYTHQNIRSKWDFNWDKYVKSFKKLMQLQKFHSLQLDVFLGKNLTILSNLPSLAQ